MYKLECIFKIKCKEKFKDTGCDLKGYDTFLILCQMVLQLKQLRKC